MPFPQGAIGRFVFTDLGISWPYFFFYFETSCMILDNRISIVKL